MRDFHENPAGISRPRGCLTLTGHTVRQKIPKKAFFSACFSAGESNPITGEGKIPAERLKAGFLNVTYPSYQAAEAFGRRKRKVSSTDRRSGVFENNLLESRFFLFSSLEVCVIRKVMSCLLPAVAVVAMCTSTWAADCGECAGGCEGA